MSEPHAAPAATRPQIRLNAPTEPKQSAADLQAHGDELAAEGRLDEAIESYKAAVRAEGDNPDHLTRLGDAFIFAEDSGQALTLYRRALKANPNHADTHFSIA